MAAMVPDPTSAFAARELGVMAAEWHRRGLTLTPRGEVRGRLPGGRDCLTPWLLDRYSFGTGFWLTLLNKLDSSAREMLPSLGLAGLSAGLVAYLDRGKGMTTGCHSRSRLGSRRVLLRGFLDNVASGEGALQREVEAPNGDHAAVGDKYGGRSGR
ncbi:MAG: hypothetical protein RMJ98_02895 [Myxococcales bacterium]|nr:hypothetical protein [Polyangiaceae bacterium]MDW8248237.1 hypothetical protein [Myxococcales bacterium]